MTDDKYQISIFKSLAFGFAVTMISTGIIIMISAIFAIAVRNL